ncbi:MAG: hypothetical protein ACOY3F_08060 [Bacillota bacterium]
MYLQAEARCPYCHESLPRVPQRRAKCPGCGQFYCIRTRPSDREKVIVTEQEADAIDAEWAVRRILGDPCEWEEKLRSLPRDASPWERPYYEAMLARSRRQYDRAWGLYNEARLRAGQEFQMGIHRNITLDMAGQLEVEGKTRQALALLCEVCYYDLNGASNAGGGRRVLFGRPWDLDGAFLAPAVVGEIRECVRRLGFAREEFRGFVLELLRPIHRAMKTPLGPEAVLPAFVEIAFTDKDVGQISLPSRKRKPSGQ